MDINAGQKPYKLNYSIWIICSLFVFLQFFLQLSSGIIIGRIMQEMKFSALTAGILSSSFYIIYTSLQIPVGILADNYNPRMLLIASSLTCSIGCIMFATSHALHIFFIARILIGIGSAFAFVIMVHIVRSHYPLKYFATLIGISETLGFLATAIGIIGMGQFVTNLGWRMFMQMASILAAFLSALFWIKIPNAPKPKYQQVNYILSLKKIISNKFLWMNGLFIGLCFATITVFGGLWAAPFLKLKLQCNINQVSITNALLFIGAALGCPLFGGLANIFPKRKPLLLASCILSALLFILLIFTPNKNLIYNAIILFLLGICCCAYILSYEISNELAPPNSLATCTGFTNTLALCTTPILQPLIGWILDFLSQPPIYKLKDFQETLVILPIGLLIAGILGSFLPEKNITNQR